MKNIQIVLEESLNKAIDYFDVSGAAVGVSIANNSPLPYAGLDTEYALGYSDYDNKIPLRKNEVFHFASVSKLFVSTAIMQLTSKGLLNIDDKITELISDLDMDDSRFKDITVRQMLSHTAGIPDVSDYHWDAPKYDENALRDYVHSNEVSKGHLLFNPGEGGFVYSNMAYEMLGFLISKLSGQTFEQYIADNIFIPLSMRDSTFLTFLRDAEKSRLASPHSKDKQNHIHKLNIYPYNREHAPSSTLTSTIMDIKKWGQAHIEAWSFIEAQTNDKENAVDESLPLFADIPYEQIWTPLADVTGGNEKIGLGWFIRKQKGYTLYGHEGSDDGFRSSFWICPELKTQIIVLSNLDKAPVKKINKKLFELLLDK